MNLLTIQQECGRLLSDPTNDRWSPSVLTLRANLAQTEIEGYTKAIKTVEALTLTSAGLILNANTMDITRVNMAKPDGSTKDLLGLSLDELIYRYPNYSQWTAGEPQFWIYDATTQSLTFYPTASAQYQIASGLSVVEIRKPTDLAVSTDIPFDSNNQMVPYHYALVHWVVAHCFMDDGTPEALQKAKFHKSGSMLGPGEYEKELGRILAEFDVPEAMPAHILWQPQGGRIGTLNYPTKSNPLG